MSILLTGLLLSVTVTTGARADEKSHRAAVQEYFNVAQMDALMQRGMDVAVNAQLQANPQLKPYEAKMRQYLAKYMSWKALQEDITAMYMKAFTEDEIKQVTAFYKTPAGKKTLQQMPIILAEGAALGAKRVQDHMPELQKMLEEGSSKGGSAASPKSSSTTSPKTAH